uniref:tRNA-yW synthesizing protein 5 n=1 Tax=Eptatretus burgeri TaxID=7764 RepID=A0A8C4Q4L2_EPTBU
MPASQSNLRRMRRVTSKNPRVHELQALNDYCKETIPMTWKLAIQCSPHPSCQKGTCNERWKTRLTSTLSILHIRINIIITLVFLGLFITNVFNIPVLTGDKTVSTMGRLGVMVYLLRTNQKGVQTEAGIHGRPDDETADFVAKPSDGRWWRYEDVHLLGLLVASFWVFVVVAARSPHMTESCKVRVVEPVTRDIFLQDVQPKRQPAVLRGLDLGVCTQCWNVDYLREKVGERPVKVHVAPSPFMDFLHKNFAYRTLPFNELMHRASEEKHADFFFNEDVADLKQQFPELAGDVTIPQLFPDEQFFSSVLRVSSASLHLWTHYDVMDNLLMQVTGYKRVVLFSPEDVEFLYLRGDKSEILDIDFPDLTRFPEFPRATRYECNLQPGDTLYIPALWMHNVLALTFSIGINVFWRHLPTSCYNSRDKYANCDAPDATRGLSLLEKALGALRYLPSEHRAFYARRMAHRARMWAAEGSSSGGKVGQEDEDSEVQNTGHEGSAE